MKNNSFQECIHKNTLWDLNYIETDFAELETELIYSFLHKKLEEINSILENTEQKNWLKYNIALKNKEDLEKKFHEYLKFKEKTIDNKNKEKIIDNKNLIKNLKNILDDISHFLKGSYNVILKADEDYLRVLLENISKKITKNWWIISNLKLNQLVNKEFLEKVHNFLYIYEEQINELNSNPKNKIILEIIWGKLNLYTEEYTIEELEIQMEDYKKSREDENIIEKYEKSLKWEEEYDIIQEKSEKDTLENLLVPEEEMGKKLKFKERLENLQNINEDIGNWKTEVSKNSDSGKKVTMKEEEFKWNPDQNIRLRELQEAIWKEGLKEIKEIAWMWWYR